MLVSKQVYANSQAIFQEFFYHGFWALNSGCQPCTVSVLTYWARLGGLLTYLHFVDELRISKGIEI